MQTIHLTAAYHAGTPLPELVDELRTIENVLQPLVERKLWQLNSNRAANLKDIFTVFTAHSAKIQLFHYAGHADQEELLLEDGGHIRGIAGLMGLAEPTANGLNPLRFVFLNGCATKGQINHIQTAGVQAIIATSRKIGDATAKKFAASFYQTWAKEGKTLEQAFQTAKAFVHSDPDQQHRSVVLRTEAEPVDNSFAWGLYTHPDLGTDILNWQLNPTVQLPPQILADVRVNTSESLLELVYDFEALDAEAAIEIENGKDPLLVLITRLPWTVGSHLRRLFAVEATGSMSKPSIERLRELVSAYTELTRFISYVALSLIWDKRHQTDALSEQLTQLPLIPDAAENSIDYVWRLRQYLAILKDGPNSDSNIIQYLGDFLNKVDKELSEGYRFYEELKQVLEAKDFEKRLHELINTRTGKIKGDAEICLQTETIFTLFLRASLWLTKYHLYTVRSVLVDKIRFLEMKMPYIHKTMTLHGAFSDIKLLSTKREMASDNSCILFAPRQSLGKDPLADAINLSPFYIDKSAYLEEKITHYPAIYVLKHKGEKDEFIYEYLDGDVNYAYIFKEDHRLVIRRMGAVFSAALKVSLKDSKKFQIIHKQLQKLKRDFSTI